MKHAQKGFDKVLLIRVGAYAEVNLVGSSFSSTARWVSP